MPFQQLTWVIAAGDAEAVESACLQAGALSVSLFDAADSPILEPALGATPLWPAVRLQALFAEGTDRATVRFVLETLLGRGAVEVSWETVPDRAWEREWLKDFVPMRFGVRLWVCPQGQAPPQADATIVWLDPGLAFGTGTHATTAMCLTWLDGVDLHGVDVIDYGCGSGILAIAALKLGARRATALDLDPQALTATHDNAFRNGVAGSIRVQPASEWPPLADVLLANILAEPLIALAPTLQGLVHRAGAIVLSGILRAQTEAVASAFAPWFDMRPFATRDDWVCLEGVRR